LQIDWAASQIGKRHLVNLGLVGAAQPTLKALAARVAAREPSDFVLDLKKQRRNWLAALNRQAEHQSRNKGPIHPQWVADRLSHLVDEDANIAVDVGNALVWMSRHFRIRHQGWLVSAWLGSMGFGLPAAIAAKIAEPDRQSIAVVGDGAFAMLMADFVTSIKYGWPVTVVVLNNRKLGMIKFEQEVHGMPEFGTDLLNPDFAAYARAAGGQGYLVERADQLESALRAALAERRSSVVDVWVNPDEIPLPPRISFDQARGYAEAWFRETLNV
jgi:pyruvate oxidase